MKEFTYYGVPKKITKVLADAYPLISYNQVQRLLKNKDIKVCGQRISSDVVICDASPIVVYDKAQSLKTIYSDSELLVVYKPKGIASEGEVSAESMLAETDKSLILCHRLDTNTDGLLMFAKNDKAFNEIQNGFKNKSIAKHYRARVYGKILNDCRLTDYLVKEVKGNRVMIFAEKVKGGVEVVTDCKVTGYDGETTLVDLVIFSGKMHQIRAQLAYHKHFILGDSKYGRDDINRKLGFKKQQLTANKLTFSFPDSSYLRYLNDKNIEID